MRHVIPSGAGPSSAPRTLRRRATRPTRRGRPRCDMRDGWNVPRHGWNVPRHGWNVPHHGWNVPRHGWNVPRRPSCDDDVRRRPPSLLAMVALITDRCTTRPTSVIATTTDRRQTNASSSSGLTSVMRVGGRVSGGATSPKSACIMVCHGVSWCVMVCHGVPPRNRGSGPWCVMVCHGVPRNPTRKRSARESTHSLAIPRRSRRAPRPPCTAPPRSGRAART